jgi:hypothetical protein
MKWPSLFTRNRPLFRREGVREPPAGAEIDRLLKAVEVESGNLRNTAQAVQSASRVYSRRLNLMADTLALKRGL